MALNLPSATRHPPSPPPTNPESSGGFGNGRRVCACVCVCVCVCLQDAAPEGGGACSRRLLQAPFLLGMFCRFCRVASCCDEPSYTPPRCLVLKKAESPVFSVNGPTHTFPSRRTPSANTCTQRVLSLVHKTNDSHPHPPHCHRYATHTTKLQLASFCLRVL